MIMTVFDIESLDAFMEATLINPNFSDRSFFHDGTTSWRLKKLKKVESELDIPGISKKITAGYILVFSGGMEMQIAYRDGGFIVEDLDLGSANKEDLDRDYINEISNYF